MNWRLQASFVSALALWGCGRDLSEFPQPALPDVVLATKAEIENDEVKPGSYIVAFKGRSIRHRQLHMRSYRDEWAFHNAYLSQDFTYDPHVKSVRYIHALDMARQGFDPEEDQFFLTPGLRRSLVGQNDLGAPAVLAQVEFSTQAEAAETLAAWEKAGKLWFAEPNYKSKSADLFTDYKATYESSSPWWHTSIKLLEAFELIASSQSKPSDEDILANPPVIAVLDSGVDIEHPALSDRIFTNSSPGLAGCVNDTKGCDTTDPAKGELGTGDVTPFAWTGSGCNEADKGVCQHGTHVAGIIAATYDANVSGSQGGAGGVCPVCQIMPIKIISGEEGKGAAQDSAILNGLVYLSRFQSKSNQSALVRVANSSFGKYSRSRAVALMVSILADNHELLVVGAASNEDSMARAYPAALDDALAVAAVDNKDRKAPYSNFGSWVDVAAPGGAASKVVGDGIYTLVSTVPRGTGNEGGSNYQGKQGTSMAAPVVAGVAGLILAVDPERGLRSLRSSLINTADARLYNPEGDTAFNQYYYVDIGEPVKQPLLGSGIVDAPAAILNEKKTGITVSALSRVNAGCGVVGHHFSSFFVLFFLIPIGGAWAHRLLRRGAL